MRIRERFLLGFSGVMLAASGAKQLVHELITGLTLPPAAAGHAGTAGAAFAHGYQTGFIFGEQISIALKLLCGVALLAWCLRDITRNRTAGNHTAGQA